MFFREGTYPALFSGASELEIIFLAFQEKYFVKELISVLCGG